MIHDVLDEWPQVERLEVVTELVVLDPVDRRKVLHQVSQAGRAAVDAVDERDPGLLVEAMLLGQQGVCLGLDAGERRLQLMGHHRDEIRPDLVDLLQSLRTLLFQRLAATGLVELGGPLDRRPQRTIEAGAHVTHEEPGDQRDEEEEEDTADDEPGWR